MSSLFRAMVVSHNSTQLRSCRRHDHGAQRGELSSPTSVTHPGDRRQTNRQDGGSGRQVHGSSRCTSCSVLNWWIAFSPTRRSLRSTPRLVRARRPVRRDLNSFRHRRRHAKWAAELPRPRRPNRSRGSRAKRSRQRTTTASSHSPDGQLDVVGGAGAHPDELPRRVMTTHPAAVDAGPRTASGGSVEARKYRTCGGGCVRRGIGPGRNAPERGRNQDDVGC
jgi:hypothetical protein